MKSVKLAILLPSRGLVFSKTVEELLREVAPYNHKIFWSHGRPIPDCFEIPTQEILKDKSFTHLLTVEEDMIIPEGTLRDAIEADKPVVAYDYPVTGSNGGTILYDIDGSAYFSGCGFLLVDMNIVRRLKPPIWRVDIEWNMKQFNNRYRFDIKLVDDKKNYGQQDIAFGLRLYYNNTPIYVMPKTIGQRKLEKRGKGRTNKGAHEIIEYMDIYRHDAMKYAKAEDSLVPIKMFDGEIVHTDERTANIYLDKNMARRLTRGHAEFHNTELIEEWLEYS